MRIEHIVTGTWLHGSRGRKCFLPEIFSLQNLKNVLAVSVCLKNENHKWHTEFIFIFNPRINNWTSAIFSDSPYERQQVTKEKDKRTKEIVTRRWDRAELLKVPYSGGSRISPRWERQPSWGHQYTILPKNSQKLHEIERIWTPGGVQNFTIWIRYCLTPLYPL